MTPREEQVVVRLYNVDRMSLHAIANQTKRGVTTIHSIVRKHGVSRTPGESRTIQLDTEKIKELYESGISCREIGNRLGVDHTVVLHRLEDLEIPRRSPSECQQLDVDEEEVIRLYRSGLPMQRIALDVGCSITPIRRVLSERGIVPRASWDYAVNRRQGDVSSILRLYKGGVSIVDIGSKLGLNYQAVRRRLLEQGIPIRPSDHYHRMDLDIDYAIHLYVERRLPTEQVAALMGVSSNTITRRLKGAGIKIRSSSQFGRILYHKRLNAVFDFDSGWEVKVYTMLLKKFGDTFLFQGDRREGRQTSIVLLAKPPEVKRIWCPSLDVYSWTPDFLVPGFGILEVKGGKYIDRWEDVITPSIRNTDMSHPVWVLLDEPYRMRRPSDLRKALKQVLSRFHDHI